MIDISASLLCAFVASCALKYVSHKATKPQRKPLSLASSSSRGIV